MALLRASMMLIVICDPLGALGVATAIVDCGSRAPARRLAATAVGASFVALAGAALLADRLLGLLDLSAGSVALAAAIVSAVPGLWLLARGDRRALVDDARGGGLSRSLVPLAFPVLAGPAPLLVAITIAATRGTAMALGASGLAMLVAGGLVATSGDSPARRYPTLVHRIGGRLVGLAMLVVAAALAVEGLLGP